MKPIYEYTDYNELLLILKEKYGIPKKPYFTNNTSYSKVQSNSRGKEGLYIHHDREDRVIKLSDANYNMVHNYPFEYHLPENLTYCNYIEHFMLHVLIACGENSINIDLRQELGIQGIVTFFVPQINTYLARAYEYKQEWLLKALSVFDGEEGYNSYIKCLNYLLKHYNGFMYKSLIDDLCAFDIMVTYDKEKANKFETKIRKDLLEV